MPYVAPFKIVNYGPVETAVNTKFNVQHNGMSAMWFDTGSAEYKDIIVEFNGHYLKTVCNGNLLSALVPDNLLKTAGNCTLKLFPENDTRATVELNFSIKGNLFDRFPFQKSPKRIRFKKPNFFIVGAPRSGTTSMHWHLSFHRNVYMSKLKEPFYFDKRAHGVIDGAVRDMDSYLELFKYSHSDARVVGESSTTYLSSPEAMNDIYRFNNKAKILIMLRDPISASLSLYQRMKEGGVYEKESTFDNAWRNDLSRTFLNNYKQLYLIGDQLENAFDIFNNDMVEVVLFDDLVANSASVYERVIGFLGLPVDNGGFIQKGNSATWADLDKIVSRDVYDEMVEYFRPQVNKVASILGRDLCCWLKPYENY